MRIIYNIKDTKNGYSITSACQMTRNCTHISLHFCIFTTTPELKRPKEWSNWNPTFCAVSCDMALTELLLTGKYNMYANLKSPPSWLVMICLPCVEVDVNIIKDYSTTLCIIKTKKLVEQSII